MKHIYYINIFSFKKVLKTLEKGQRRKNVKNNNLFLIFKKKLNIFPDCSIPLLFQHFLARSILNII